MSRAVDGTKHKKRRKRFSIRPKGIGDAEVPTTEPLKMLLQKLVSMHTVSRRRKRETLDLFGLPVFLLLFKQRV